tara:strand:+ start:2816 stop:3034 length:219 start_codon:yes stop_codon:yes gene_type:complete
MAQGFEMTKGWRTITFNAVTASVTIAGAGLMYVDQLGLTTSQAAIAGFVLTLVNTFGNMFLRAITTTPVGSK